MVDVVDLDLPLALAQLEHVPDGRDQILGPERHLSLGHVEAKLAIDAKPADSAEAVAVGVLKLLVEQGSSLVEGRRIPRTEPLVDSHERVLVAGCHAGPPLRLVGIFTKTIDDQGHLLLLHQLDGRKTRRADQLRLIMRDLAARIDNDLARPLARLRIHDVVNGDLSLEFDHAAAARNLLLGRRVEEFQDLRVVRVLRIHRPQERER